jgi:DNA-directed RNA polymerase specialized sigma24 family protein
LPEQQKIVVQMRDVEQYEFAEIAQILQMNGYPSSAFKRREKQ